MATGTVQFQSATLATPLAGLSVMADAVNDTDHGAGTTQYVKVMDGRTGGTIKQAVTANGAEVDVTRVQGTIQALGSIQGVGTFQVLGSVQTVGTSQVLGSVQGVGTFQVLGTVQTHGTSQVLGTVQAHGTNQALGTFQPLAGSVHLAAGSVNAQGVIAHGAAIAGNPVLFGAFGSSGTQAAVADGQLTRLWSDLNGRLQVRGTIDSLPNVTIGGGTVGAAGGTFTVVGTVQTEGTSQVLGSVQTVGTSQVLGSVQTVGTSQALGTLAVQGLVAHDGVGAGNPLMQGGQASRARPGTVAADDAVRAWFDQHGRQIVQVGIGTSEPFGTAFTAAGNGTVLTGRGVGSYTRIYDLVLSASAQGTFRLLEDGTVRYGPIFLAANGGWNMNSAVGVRMPTANTSLVASVTAGTWALTINYGVEGA